MKPRYSEIKDFVRTEIADGRWRENDRLPSENELADMFNVSRLTTNRALRELSLEGKVVRVPGVGTFVAKRRAQGHPLKISDIADEIHARNHEHSSVILLLAKEKAAKKIADEFNLGMMAELYRSIIVHYENGHPIQYEDRFVNPALAPEYLDQDFGSITPSSYLMEVAPLQEATHTVRASIPGESIRKALRMRPGEPCLTIIRKTWSHDQLATISTLHYPGSRYELSGRYNPEESG